MSGIVNFLFHTARDFFPISPNCITSLPGRLSSLPLSKPTATGQVLQLMSCGTNARDPHFSDHYYYHEYNTLSLNTTLYRHTDIHTQTDTPVFNKRLNFLSSAPTNIEGALRLLSAPSGRFWQQTAICLVSLWALVVELHPLNWARAQAARRIKL
jgi:hypothetical protein